MSEARRRQPRAAAGVRSASRRRARRRGAWARRWLLATVDRLGHHGRAAVARERRHRAARQHAGDRRRAVRADHRSSDRSRARTSTRRSRWRSRSAREISWRMAAAYVAVQIVGRRRWRLRRPRHVRRADPAGLDEAHATAPAQVFSRIRGHVRPDRRRSWAACASGPSATPCSGQPLHRRRLLVHRLDVVRQSRRDHRPLRSATPSPASRPGSAPYFIVAQLVGAVAASLLFGWMLRQAPAPRSRQIDCHDAGRHDDRRLRHPVGRPALPRRPGRARAAGSCLRRDRRRRHLQPQGDAPARGVWNGLLLVSARAPGHRRQRWR